MSFMEIIPVDSENAEKNINTPCGHMGNAKFQISKQVDTAAIVL
jgi:hypothetical protein